MTRRIAGRDMPVFMKKDMVEQIPGLKKANLRNRDYADRTVQELFEERIDSAIRWEVSTAASMVALNDGKGLFRTIPLPDLMQLSSVRAIRLTDVNQDGRVDLLAAGNYFDLLPQFCRIDASAGHVAINQGQGSFSVVPSRIAGLSENGQSRHILPIRTPKGPAMLFVQNNERPKLYRQTTGSPARRNPVSKSDP
jgi:hypothetical protein